jgi:hypothetical protein
MKRSRRGRPQSADQRRSDRHRKPATAVAQVQTATERVRPSATPTAVPPPATPTAVPPPGESSGVLAGFLVGLLASAAVVVLLVLAGKAFQR